MLLTEIRTTQCGTAHPVEKCIYREEKSREAKKRDAPRIKHDSYLH